MHMQRTAGIVRGQSIVRVRVDIGAQIVRTHAPFEEIADRYHILRGRDIADGAIQPLPHMGLRDFAIRHAGADTRGQGDLPIGKGNRFFKGF